MSQDHVERNVRDGQPEQISRDAGGDASSRLSDAALSYMGQPKTYAGSVESNVSRADRMENYPTELVIADLNTSRDRGRLDSDAAARFRGAPERLESFRSNMRAFEARAEMQNLSPAEVAATYRQVDRLLQAGNGGPLSADRRLNLAEQVMTQAANPFGINQGQHGTCSMNALEVRAYNKAPSAAASLVADVALTGRYNTKDGQSFRINAAPHDESREAVVRDGKRSHASEIFQVTAANILMERGNKELQVHVPGAAMRYEQRTPTASNDTGEFVVAYTPDGKSEVMDGIGVPSTGKTAGWMVDTLAAITGKSEPGTFLIRDRAGVDSSANLAHVNSVDDLRNVLSRAGAKQQYPISVFVSTGNDPFWSDSGTRGEGGGHVVNITGYKPESGTVMIDNSWTATDDHGDSNPITVQALFNSMGTPAESVPSMIAAAQAARANGGRDYSTEIDVLRVQAQYDMQSAGLTEDQLSLALDGGFDQWRQSLSPVQGEAVDRKVSVIVKHTSLVNKQKANDKNAYGEHEADADVPAS